MSQLDVQERNHSGMTGTLPPDDDNYMTSRHIKHEARDDAPSEKAPTAFKTISEVADQLGLPQHVLRFWESKFKQIKPLKLRGGRRYYRPDDIEIIATIRHLLYSEGYTINGAKRALEMARKNQKTIQEPAATQAALTAAIQRSAEALPAAHVEVAAKAPAPAVPATPAISAAPVAAVPAKPVAPVAPAKQPQKQTVPFSVFAEKSGAPPLRISLPIMLAPEKPSDAPKPASAQPPARAANPQRRSQLESIRNELLGLRDTLAQLRRDYSPA